MRQVGRLTALKVNRLKELGRYGDGGGLVLQISQWGTKSWLFRFERNGRERQMGLGPVADVTLAEARETALACRKLLREGFDPIEQRQKARARALTAVKRGISFKECAEKFVAAHEAGWSNPKHRKQWKSTLEKDAYPIIGNLPIAAVDTALVIKILEPIWTTKPETASRIRGRIESVLDWAKARGFRDGENPARWRGHLDKLLPNRGKVQAVKHLEALSYDDIPAFMADLRKQKGVSARALEWTILACARSGEALGAKHSEISQSTWTVPAQRMKAGREHRVPLCSRAIEILENLPRENDFLFPGTRKGAPIGEKQMRNVLRAIRPGLTVHGFRSTFRDWAAERTNYQNHVVEMALAHVVGDKVEAAYRRGDLFEKRRRLMNDWAKYCSHPTKRGEAANVVELRA